MNTQDNSSELEIRKQKIADITANGQIVYKDSFVRTHLLKDMNQTLIGQKVKVAGRIVFRRIMGKFGFCKIQDAMGAIQISVGVNELQDEAYAFYKKMIDIGDFIGVEGEVYATQTGELTVKANSVTLLSKSLRPLPEKFHGLTDIEARYRQRYLDLVMNSKTREVMLGRSKITNFIRNYLAQNGFLEVETPILQSAVCGASAKPFYTKHNALDKICNLRIAPEVYLKQVIAGGFDKVFELGKDFRNEGMDTQHLQEFTMLEWYASYWNFEDNIKFYRDFIQKLLLEIKGTTTIEYQGQTLDFGGEWARIDYCKELTKILGFDFLQFDSRDQLVEKVASTKLFASKDFDGIKTVGGVIDYIYKRTIREKIVQPTVLYNYPTCLIPLARRNDEDPRKIDAFQVVAVGFELCKAYSELIDPIEQRKAFEEQAKARLEGDDEAMDLDEDFLLAMEHGMPPISGLGFGLDRLMTIIYDLPSVRDAVLFPLMK